MVILLWIIAVTVMIFREAGLLIIPEITIFLWNFIGFEESEDGSWKTGDGRPKTGVGSPESEDRRPETEVRSRKTEVGRQKSGDGRPETQGPDIDEGDRQEKSGVGVRSWKSGAGSEVGSRKTEDRSRVLKSTQEIVRRNSEISTKWTIVLYFNTIVLFHKLT
jgi:hypothetical protein